MHFLKKQSFFDRIREVCMATRYLLSGPSLLVAKTSSDAHDYRIKGIHLPTSGGTEIIFSATSALSTKVCD